MNVHSLSLNDIRGFGRKKPLLLVSFLMGALGIGGIPLWNGYVSKTLIHESIVEYAHVLAEEGASAFPVHALEWIFLISGGITLAYMTKLFVCIFVEKNPTRQAEYDGMKKYMTGKSAFAIVGSAAVLPVLGFVPGLTMDKIADVGTDFFRSGHLEESIKYFSPANLKGAAISIVIGAVLYFAVVRKLLMSADGSYENRWPAKLDLEELVYRPVLMEYLPAGIGGVTRVFGENLVLTPVCRGVMYVLRVITRAACDLLDGAVILLKRSIYKEYVPKSDDHLSKSVAYRVGHRLDETRGKHRRGAKGKEKYAETFVRAEASVKHTWRKISGNLSMALLTLCAAICFVLIYVLIVYGKSAG